ALLVATSALVLRERRRLSPAATESAGGRIERAVRWLSFVLARRLGVAVAAGALVVGAGLALEGRFDIETDAERWVPQDSATVRDLQRLREITEFTSELVL